MEKSLTSPQQDDIDTSYVELFAQYSELLELLYSASLSPTGFQPFLDKLVEVFNLADATIYFTKKSTLDVYSAWLSGPKAPALIEFVDRKLDSANYVMDYVQSNPMSRFYSLDKDIGRSPIETRAGTILESEEWFDSHGYRDMCGAVIHHDSESVACIAAHRLIAQGPFEPKEMLILDNLMPHIKQAYLLYQQNAKHGNFSNWANIIEHITQPTLVFGPRVELLQSNSKARQLLHELEDVYIDGQQVIFENPEYFRQFTVKALKTCCLDFSEDQTFQVLNILDTSTRNLTLVFTPIQVETGIQGVLVYLIDKTSHPQINPTLLHDLYQLSETEIRVCEYTLRGYSRQEIADQLNRSPHTIKDHLKSIYSKTGTRKQAELIVMILTTTNLTAPPTWGETKP